MFFRKPVLVPLNIVLYNVFSSHGKGPDIFGTDPWHFYIRNLAINFNIWFPLALLSFPLLLLQSQFSRRDSRPSSQKSIITIRSFILISPFYLWLAIFSLQPHKEERFMYPIYPLLCLNAAMSFHIILSAFGTIDASTLVGRIPAPIKLLVVSIITLTSILFGLARIYGIHSAYMAPLHIYNALHTHHPPNQSSPSQLVTVCFGKDWYRLPTSYLLPAHTRPKFIKSHFTGLLPGEFKSPDASPSWRPGTHTIPAGMNDANRQDPLKYVRCIIFFIIIIIYHVFCHGSARASC